MQIVKFIRNGLLCKKVIEYIDDDIYNAIQEQLEKQRVTEIKDKYNKQLQNLLDSYALVSERETWAQQFNEASAYLSATQAKKYSIMTPLIDSLIISRGLNETKEELANKIIQNNQECSLAIAELLGKQKQELQKKS